MSMKTFIVTIPEEFYEESKKLIDSGLYEDFSAAVQAGLRSLLEEYFDDSDKPEKHNGQSEFAYHLQKLRQEINKMGGLFPGKSPEEVIEILRQTRKEIYEEKYAPHLRHK